ncbi:MAG: hypothetical protein ABI193_25475 [Minicystis sp.]
MIPALEPAQLQGPAQKIAAPTAPPKLQEMAAKGIAPGVKPADMVALLVILSGNDRPPVVKETAEKTLAALPEPLLNGALAVGDLHPAVIEALARAYPERLDVLEKLISMPQIHGETVEELARTGSETVTELIATNEDRLLKNQRIIELLYMNKRTRMSTADRLIDLAVRNGLTLTGIPAFKEAAAAIQDELIPMASDEPTPDDLLFQETLELAERLAAVSAADEDTHHLTETGEEEVDDKFAPLYVRIANMTMSQKVRRAILGTKEERMMLVRDRNRVVATAAIRSPLLQENEVVLISRNRNMSEDVLRVIATSPEWTKSYGVKKNLIENPKTPTTISTRMITQLREADLRHLAKNKNVPGAVQEAARRHLGRRNS